MRHLLLIPSLALLLVAAMKAYAAFKKPNAAPELMADATMFVIGSIALYAFLSWVSKKKTE
jgi:hypothetical protein